MKEIFETKGGRAFFNELNAAGIPFFFIAATENTEDKTDYLCETITPGAMGIRLTDDKQPEDDMPTWVPGPEQYGEEISIVWGTIPSETTKGSGGTSTTLWRNKKLLFSTQLLVIIKIERRQRIREGSDGSSKAYHKGQRVLESVRG